MFNIDKFKEIHCPHCDGLCDFLEDAWNDGLVTYWGEENVVDLKCPHCEKSFSVIEKVRRTFEIYKGL